LTKNRGVHDVREVWKAKTHIATEFLIKGVLYLFIYTSKEEKEGEKI